MQTHATFTHTACILIMNFSKQKIMNKFLKFLCLALFFMARSNIFITFARCLILIYINVSEVDLEHNNVSKVKLVCIVYKKTILIA